jgi:hypothetical protein
LEELERTILPLAAWLRPDAIEIEPPELPLAELARRPIEPAPQAPFDAIFNDAESEFSDVPVHIRILPLPSPLEVCKSTLPLPQDCPAALEIRTAPPRAAPKPASTLMVPAVFMLTPAADPEADPPVSHVNAPDCPFIEEAVRTQRSPLLNWFRALADDTVMDPLVLVPPPEDNTTVPPV